MGTGGASGMPVPERCAAGTYDILTKRVNGSCSAFSSVFFTFAKTREITAKPADDNEQARIAKSRSPMKEKTKEADSKPEN
jgi:hypothetical protein